MGEPYAKAMRKRKVWVEPLFAEGKDWHRMRRFRLRRLWRVNCEALLLAAGQNLKRLLRTHGWGQQPFPSATAEAREHCNVDAPRLFCGILASIGCFAWHARNRAIYQLRRAA